jgi:predicted alpha/beta-fold hydrolase
MEKGNKFVWELINLNQIIARINDFKHRANVSQPSSDLASPTAGTKYKAPWTSNLDLNQKHPDVLICYGLIRGNLANASHQVCTVKRNFEQILFHDPVSDQ